MIYTLTLNPAVDYLMGISDLNIGGTNRSLKESVSFGGKGVNVSVVLTRLGIPNIALGFIAGFTGDALEAFIKSSGVKTDFIKLEKGITRINVKLKGEKETEINALGPKVTFGDISRLLKKLDCLRPGDTVVLAGSIPGSLPNDTYALLMSQFVEKGVKFVVDSCGEALLSCLQFKPFLIKPNLDELQKTIGCKLESIEEIIGAAKILKVKGAENVLVSLGENGAVLIDSGDLVHRVSPKSINSVDTVGAGDSMIAGFLAGVDKGYDYALRLGNAAGAATASVFGLADTKLIFEILNDK